MKEEQIRLRELSKKLWQETEGDKLLDKVSARVWFAVGRGYIDGLLTKPLEQITDKEFLKVFGLGQFTLAEIRQVIPKPHKGAACRT